MRIEFVNHASLLADCGEVRLLCDPWLEGTAFDDGWALLSPSAFGPGDWTRVTHLWFSHEHPDHFSPAALREVPDELRRRIAVLYQATADRKVVEFCRRLGFSEVRELSPGAWADLGGGVSALCEPWTSGDSWLALRTPRATFVNLNDCAIYTPAEIAGIAAKVGQVDLLATQFSISAWDGNPEDAERLRRGADKMLERMVVHARGLEARWTLPFASFVWFCHEENADLNRFHNRVETAAAALRERTRSAPLVLYPGDRWELDTPHDPASAIARYALDYDAVPSRPLKRSAPVPEAADGAAGAVGEDLVLEADFSRPGIYLYGGRVGNREPHPVAAFRARVVAVRRIAGGESVGYGATWRAPRSTTIVTVAAGYADGLHRRLSRRGRVEIGGSVHPIAGPVTMDLTMVDGGDLPVRVGDVATFYGGLVSLDDQAAAADTIGYELLATLGPRVIRRYRDGGPGRTRE